jgi:hypothetical protein
MIDLPVDTYYKTLVVFCRKLQASNVLRTGWVPTITEQGLIKAAPNPALTQGTGICMQDKESQKILHTFLDRTHQMRHMLGALMQTAEEWNQSATGTMLKIMADTLRRQLDRLSGQAPGTFNPLTIISCLMKSKGLPCWLRL